MTTIRRRLHNPAKELPLERVNANVIVAYLRWIDETPDDDSSAGELSSGFLLLANKRIHRLPSERFNRSDQRFELRTRFPCRSSCCVIWLPAMSVRRVAQLDSPARHDLRRLRRPLEHDSTGPT